MQMAGRWACQRIGQLALALGLLLGVSGCYEQHTRVIVYPDGSGRIVVSRLFPATTVRLIELQASQAGMADNLRAEDLFYSEARLKRDARTLFGKGVRFVAARRVETNGNRGSVALYAFDKVDGLALAPDRLSENSMSAMGGSSDEEDDADQTAEVEQEATAGDEGAEDEQPYNRGGAAYRFAFAPGPQPRLTVKVPKALRTAPEDNDSEMTDRYEEMMSNSLEEMPDEFRQSLTAGGNPLQLTGRETPVELIVKFFKGMRLSI